MKFDFDQIMFVTADTHFGHARINELARRPFASVDEMNRELISRWNDVVAPNDAVLHLGDLALGVIHETLPLTGQLLGRRYLVPGNHDRVSTATQSHAAIARFAPLYEAAGWTILPEIISGTRHGISLLASHYPYVGDSQDVDRHANKRPTNTGIPLLHGHTHSHDYGSQGNQFHVGVDAAGYSPLPFSIIDAWLAGAPARTDSAAGRTGPP